MRHAGLLVLVLVIGALPFALACQPTTPVGSSLGTFAVHGELEQNGCAPGLSPVDPLDFQVELHRDRANLRWQRAGGPPVTGVIDDAGEFRLVTRSQVEAWPADPPNGVVGCSLTQIETVEGTIQLAVSTDAAASSDAAVPSDADADAATARDGGVARVASFAGTDEIQIVPVVGTDCSALLLVEGGSFPTLPCTAQYALTAARR